MRRQSKALLERELDSVNQQLKSLQSIIRKGRGTLLEIEMLKSERARLKSEITDAEIVLQRE